MEIEVRKEPTLTHYDSGGGCREVKSVISLADNLSPRQKRQVAIYEALGSMLGYVIPHKQLEDIAENLVDVLDQLESMDG